MCDKWEKKKKEPKRNFWNIMQFAYFKFASWITNILYTFWIYSIYHTLRNYKVGHRIKTFSLSIFFYFFIFYFLFISFFLLLFLSYFNTLHSPKGRILSLYLQKWNVYMHTWAWQCIKTVCNLKVEKWINLI